MDLSGFHLPVKRAPANSLYNCGNFCRQHSHLTAACRTMTESLPPTFVRYNHAPLLNSYFGSSFRSEHSVSIKKSPKFGLPLADLCGLPGPKAWGKIRGTVRCQRAP